MTARKPVDSIAKRRRRRLAEPLQLRLSLRYRFGDDPGDAVTVMDDRLVPMVDSVFKHRDRILRALATTMVRAGATQPKVLKELLPVIRLLGLRKRAAKRDQAAAREE